MDLAARSYDEEGTSVRGAPRTEGRPSEEGQGARWRSTDLLGRRRATASVEAGQRTYGYSPGVMATELQRLEPCLARDEVSEVDRLDT